MTPSPANPNDGELRQANVLQNNYHRPNFPWVCGNASIGEPCWTGPTADGSCGCRAECYPIARGSGWACSRPLHRGGTCSEGPTKDGRCCNERPPCVPRRSLRSQRQRLSFALLSMTLGIGLIIYGSGRTYDVIAPGPLSSPHAERLAHQGNDRCASCHPQAHQSLGQWVGGMLGGGTGEKNITQTDLCLNCHQRDMSREHSRLAHNVAPTDLAKLSEDVLNRSESSSGSIRQVSSRMVFGAPFKNGQPIACATCHREHHGQAIDMKAMTDQQCQSCHGQNFHSFELDHPEFNNWPQVAGQGIRFDHSSHHFKHFPQGNRPFECSQCHRDDRQGNVQQLVGFEQACGACHQGAIDLSIERGFALLQLPSLDVDALRASQQDVGQWPAELSRGFDGRISPLSELLLRADPEAAAGLAVLGPGFDFLDLDTSDGTHTLAAGQVAWGIKRLVADLSLRGNEAIRQRLQIVLEQPIDDQRLVRLSQNFSMTLVQDSAGIWFPQLWQELTPEQVTPKSSMHQKRPADQTNQVAESARLVLPNDILARILNPELVMPDGPQELLAENPLQGAYGASSVSNTPSRSGAVTNSTPAGSANPSVSTNLTTAAVAPSRPETKPNTASSSTTVNPPQIPTSDDPNLLAQNPLSGYGSGTDTSSSVPLEVPAEHHRANDREIANPPASGLPNKTVPGATANQEPPAQQSGTADPSSATPSVIGKSKLVGWVRDDAGFSLDYHLQGHGDLWMKEWIDVLIERQSSGAPEVWLAYLVGEMAAPDKAGNCLLCHGDRSGSNLTASVNWAARYRDPTLKGWTKFNHRPHTLLPGLSDCRSCHQLRETPAGQDSPASAVANRRPAPTGSFHWAGFSKSAADGTGQVQLAAASLDTAVPNPSTEQGQRGQDGNLQTAGHRSDFHSLTKTQCAACHQSGSTRSGCSTCHNYHVGQRVQK